VQHEIGDFSQGKGVFYALWLLVAGDLLAKTFRRIK
jgi:hypothetical protein